MKKYVLLVLAMATLLSVARAQKDKSPVYLFAYFKGNGENGLHLAYSYDAYTWTALKNDSSFVTPTAGKDKLMRDPCIIRGPKGDFHMVWTVSWNEKGIGYASSKDLIHWSAQKDIPVMEHEPGTLNCWAPEIYYEADKKRYMIYWATTIPGRFPKGDSAGDNKYNHRLYYVTTTDFITFTKAQVLYDQGFNVIDGTILRRNGKYIMVLKDETRYPPQKNLRIAYSDQLTGGYGQPSEPITGKYWAEGPTVLQKGDSVLVYFDKYKNHQYGVITSTDMKNWSEQSEKLSLPKGIRHGTVFTVSRKELELLLKQ